MQQVKFARILSRVQAAVKEVFRVRPLTDCRPHVVDFRPQGRNRALDGIEQADWSRCNLLKIANRHLAGTPLVKKEMSGIGIATP